jgi:hypothetical protein
MTSYKDIIGQFETATTLHQGISEFSYGTLDQLDGVTQNIDYSYMFLRPLQSIGLQNNTRTLTFELYSLDVPKLDDPQGLQVMTQTEFAIYDIAGYFNRGPLQQTTQVNINNITPVNEAFMDRVYGWVANITYFEQGVFNYCVFPS